MSQAKHIKDNSLQYYLLHHTAVLLGCCLISRFITLLKSYGLPNDIAGTSYIGFGLVAGIIWCFWYAQYYKPQMPIGQKIYRLGMGITILTGICLGLP